jgi:hypothetical protein
MFNLYRFIKRVFSLGTTIMAILLGLWVVPGVKQVFSDWIIGVFPQLTPSMFNLPETILDIGRLVLAFVPSLLFAIVFTRFVLPWVFGLILKPNGEYFDAETSISTKIERDFENLFYVSSRFLFSVGFLYILFLLQDGILPFYIWGVIVIVFFHGLFNAFGAYQEIAHPQTHRIFYFKTDEALTFYTTAIMLEKAWSAEMAEQFERIDRNTLDYQVALSLKADLLDMEGPDIPQFDLVSMRDPSDHYGPMTEEELMVSASREQKNESQTQLEKL